jgi:cytochrome P450/CRP-like cAMP-binding protein
MGPAYRVRVPGRRYAVLAGPRANAFLLHGGERHLTSEPTYRTLARELRSRSYPIVADGRRHRDLRRALGPAFSREAISHYVGQLVESTETIARTWPGGTRVGVVDAMRRITGEQISQAMAARPLGPRYADMLRVARVSMGSGLGAYPAVTVYWPPYRAARHRVQAFLREAVAQHRGEPPGERRRPDLVDVLLAAGDAGDGELTEHDIVVNAQMVLASVLLYTGPACACLLYALLRHPDLEEQVRAEVDEAFADGGLDMARLARMRVLQAATRESMRLYPIGLTVPRVVREPFVFEGYRLERGEPVLIATSVAHFLPENFPDPHRFDVTRYWEPRSEHRRPGAWVPFGLGARACLGAGLVEVMVAATIAALLRSVRVRLDPEGYTMRRVVNPFPEPEERMAMRVLEQRPRSVTTAGRRGAASDVPSDVLAGLDKDRLGRVTARARTLSFEPGDVIIRQGERADRFYMLTDGEVEVVVGADGPAPRVVARLGRGEYFGEIGLLQNIRRTATVRAALPVTALALDRETFLEIVADNDLTAAEINRVVTRRFVSLRLAAALPQLDHATLARVLPRVQTHRVAAGEIIVRQGDPADRFYVVTGGRVEVVNHHPRGDDITLAWLGPGEYFGEMALLQGGRRTATVRAGAEEAEVLSLDRDAFDELIRSSPGAGEDIGAVMTARLAANA